MRIFFSFFLTEISSRRRSHPKIFLFASGIFLSPSLSMYYSSIDAFLSLSLSMRSNKAEQTRETVSSSASLFLLSGVVLNSRRRTTRVLLSRRRRREKTVPRTLEKLLRIKKERRDYKTKEEEDALHSKSCKWSLFAVKSKDNK